MRSFEVKEEQNFSTKRELMKFISEIIVADGSIDLSIISIWEEETNKTTYTLQNLNEVK